MFFLTLDSSSLVDSTDLSCFNLNPKLSEELEIIGLLFFLPCVPVSWSKTHYLSSLQTKERKISPPSVCHLRTPRPRCPLKTAPQPLFALCYQSLCLQSVFLPKYLVWETGMNQYREKALSSWGQTSEMNKKEKLLQQSETSLSLQLRLTLLKVTEDEDKSAIKSWSITAETQRPPSDKLLYKHHTVCVCVRSV